MNQLYHSNGVQFRYPDDWELNEEQSIENEVSITVFSPGTSFWSLTLFLEGELPEDLVKSAIEVGAASFHLKVASKRKSELLDFIP